MAHLNTNRFPDDLAKGVVYGPEFSTEIASLAGGKEVRNRVRSYALCVGECSHVPKQRAEYTALLKFFRGMGGRFHTWRFKDWADFVCASGEGAVQARDDTNQSFQLLKLYRVVVGFDELRMIQAPIASGFVLKDGATPLTPTTDYTLDTATGIVTTATARDAEDLTWTGQFDNVCRFDADRMSPSMEHAGIVEWRSIPIREVRL